MGYRLDLLVDGEVADFISVAYSKQFEIGVLTSVFPPKFWSGENPESAHWFTIKPGTKHGFIVTPGEKGPPIFDFVGNESNAKAAIQDYFDNTDQFYEDSPDDPRPGWVETFWRLYHAGMALQIQGKETRVEIG